MALLALGLYLLGLTLAFGVRSVVQWRRTGGTGLRLDAGPAGSIRWWAKLLFIAALVLGLAGRLCCIGPMRHRGRFRGVRFVRPVHVVATSLSAFAGFRFPVSGFRRR